MTTGPDGQHLSVDARLAEILGRYGPEHLVSCSITLAAPQLTSAVARIARRQKQAN